MSGGHQAIGAGLEVEGQEPGDRCSSARNGHSAPWPPESPRLESHYPPSTATLLATIATFDTAVRGGWWSMPANESLTNCIRHRCWLPAANSAGSVAFGPGRRGHSSFPVSWPSS